MRCGEPQGFSYLTPNSILRALPLSAKTLSATLGRREAPKSPAATDFDISTVSPFHSVERINESLVEPRRVRAANILATVN